jgi:hypothetical protein
VCFGFVRVGCGVWSARVGCEPRPIHIHCLSHTTHTHSHSHDVHNKTARAADDHKNTHLRMARRCVVLLDSW